MQLRADRGVEERRRDLLVLEHGADARHGAARPVLALADAHRAFVAIAQRAGFMVAIERQGDRAARALRPGSRRQTAPGAGAADDALPGRLAPLPGMAIRM